MRKIIYTGILLFHAFLSAQAQEEKKEATDLFDLSLEELMNVPIQIASAKLQKQEDAPSIVSVITRKEIEMYGYRELSDILRTVPGFDFGIDVKGLVGLSFRGIWVHEGKCQITINGLLINDLTFGNNNLFNTLPASLIEKVEIIRGPGSSLYGGFAEIAVINIVTSRETQEKFFAQARSGIGSMGSGYTYQSSINFAVTDSTSRSSVSGSIGGTSGFMGTRDYSDNAGNTWAFSQNDFSRKWMHAILNAKFGDLTVSFNYNHFNFNGQDGYDILLPKIAGRNLEELQSTALVYGAKYRAKIAKSFFLTPRLEVNHTSPIQVGENPNAVSFSDLNSSMKNKRITEEVVGEFAQGDFHLIAGGGFIQSYAEGYHANGKPLFYGSQNDTVPNVQMDQKYILTQAEYTAKSWAITAGGRYENTIFGDAFAPRLGVVYHTGKFNGKVLYGKSYRIPTLATSLDWIFASPDIKLKPETAHSYELELGYKLWSNLNWKGNFFVMDIETPIVYMSTTNSYQNFGAQSSISFETTFQYAQRNTSGYLNVSYYSPRSGGSSTNFLTYNQNDFLGLSSLKITAGVARSIDKLTTGLSIAYLGPKIFEGPIKNSNVTQPSALLIDTNVDYKFNKKWKVTLYVNNVFDVNYVVAQPYYGYHAPMNALNRGLRLQVDYTIGD